MTDYEKLAETIFPDIETMEYFEEKYPERDLPEGAVVTRFAPSPTGFIHIGGIYQCVFNTVVKQRSGGVLFLRIEDTDQEREVENGTIQIIEGLKLFGIVCDEGNINEEEYIGNYGPYKQSERRSMYHAFAKELIKRGKAYPCFLTKDELDKIREAQQRAKIRPGIYGEYAKYRDMPVDLAIAAIEKGDEYVIRFKSPGNANRKIKLKDVVKGNLEMDENDEDLVILKRDGLPTYHFAHVVDDHLMRTTHAIRSDEWLPSMPKHVQMYHALGLKPPHYVHYSPIEKQDGDIRRKISKRKDPEASALYYIENGIPKEGVFDYLLNIANSGYEIWRKQNPKASIFDFDLQLSKMSRSGALFDMNKLLDVCKISVSYFTAEKLYDDALDWAEKYDKELAELLSKDKEYSLKVLNIERGKEKNPRKDIAKFSDVKNEIIYMYDDEFYKNIKTKEDYNYQNINDNNDLIEIIEEYIKTYDINDDRDTWWEKIGNMSEKLGYAKAVKDYRAEPDKFKGHVGDISTVLRVAITGRNQTPDLYEIMNVLGKDKVDKRLEKAIETLK